MCASLSYNHNNGYLTVPPLNLNTNTVTFTMWIYPKSATLPTSTGLFMNRNGFDAAGIGFGTTTNGLQTPCLSYTWNNNSSATYDWNSGLFPVANVWNFVACTITPSNTVMYLYYAIPGNGTNLFKAVNNVTNAPEAFTGGTTWMGSDNWNNGRTLYGCIDEVAIFTNSLSETQIQESLPESAWADHRYSSRLYGAADQRGGFPGTDFGVKLPCHRHSDSGNQRCFWLIPMAVFKWQHLGQSGHHTSFQIDHQRNVLLAEFRRCPYQL